ncbi:MAG: DNA polymerase III subunit delta' [Gammaproteobacteria bacterium]|nr:DNA polymerase III subunit delta' [Gammaproteobacteria bacterium]
MSIFPWQQSILQQLNARFQQARLPHALLFSGQSGVGKYQFAIAFAQTVLCKQATTEGHACGSCSSCLLFNAGTHPDFSNIVPAEESKYILVDQIRSLSVSLSLKSQYGGYKIVVISPSDRMNRASANSLLKTLEEPFGDTLIMMVTDQPGYLLPTIRSRCQIIRFSKPNESEAQTWLQSQIGSEQNNISILLDLAQGAPLRALEMAKNNIIEKRQLFIEQLDDLITGKQDAISLSKLLIKASIKTSVKNPLAWLTSWITDMIRLKFVPEFPLSNNKDILHKLQGLAQQVEAADLFRYLDRLNKSVMLAEGQLNQQLLLEDALICWSRLFER